MEKVVAGVEVPPPGLWMLSQTMGLGTTSIVTNRSFFIPTNQVKSKNLFWTRVVLDKSEIETLFWNHS